MSLRTTFVVLGLLLAACGVPDDTGAEPTGNSTTSTTESLTTTLEAPTTSESSMPDETSVAEAAIQELAAHLDIPEEDIEVVEVREVQWPDGALGCPEEGKMYTQAVVDGTQVILGAERRVFDYHAGADGVPFLCPSDEKDGGYEFVPPPGFDQ